MNKYYFQLLDTNYDTPKIVLLKNITHEDNEIYFEFQENIRCNSIYVLPLGKYDKHSIIMPGEFFMVQLESPDKHWIKNVKIEGEIQEKWVNQQDNDPTSEKFCIQPYVPGIKVITYIAPSNITYNPNYLNFDILIRDFEKLKDNKIENSIIEESVEEITNNIKHVQDNIVKPKIINECDPIEILAEKSKKADIDINVTFNISIPPIALYKTIKDTFEDGGEKIIEYILNNIDNNSIRESIKEGLLSVYENED